MIMFTEIKELFQAKKILKQQYKKILLLSGDSNKTYIIDKYNHLYDCLKILKKVKGKRYFKYSVPVLLHDIGRFIDNSEQDDNAHANRGYLFLKTNFTNNPMHLLPIKYHEDDLNWKIEIKKAKEYITSSNQEKEEIVSCCKLVRDIDIISNMKIILKEKIKISNKNKINKELMTLFCNQKIGKKELINNDYDKILYILCGLNLIENEECLKYIKKNQIIYKLIDKMRKADISNLETQKEIDLIENIIIKVYKV